MIKAVRLETAARMLQLREFYEGQLGLRVETEDSALIVIAGSSKIFFLPAKPDTTPYYHFAFNIPHNQVAEAVSWLQERVEVLTFNNSPIIDFPDWDAHAIYFLDPAGNIVELIARHHLANASDKPFGPDSFLSISEIGLSVPDVPAFYEGLHQQTGITVWHRSAVTERFGAVGTDEGILILSKSGRNWFPTNQRSKQFPCKVWVEQSFGTVFNNTETGITIRSTKAS